METTLSMSCPQHNPAMAEWSLSEVQPPRIKIHLTAFRASDGNGWEFTSPLDHYFLLLVPQDHHYLSLVFMEEMFQCQQCSKSSKEPAPLPSHRGLGFAS